MTMRSTDMLPWLLLATVLLQTPAAEVVFPDDPQAVLDVKKEGGAIGDGVADDTAALQNAIEACTTGQICFNGGWWKVPVLARIAGKEYRQPLAEWCTWGLLRSGE